VGGNPQSVVRAGRLGLPLAVAIIGGAPARFAPLVELYREAASRAGHDPATLPVSINSQAYVGDDPKQAADDYYRAYADVMTQRGRERGCPPMTRAQYDAVIGPQGALLVGNAEQVIEKILYEYEIFQHDRFLAQISMGALPHRKAMRAIELLGTEVAPIVRKEIASRRAEEAGTVAAGVA
jgi:alkanesulfonate monooxygenase SsuD/methylene tetrahydromethanopterin reductase-like flavin-dependent oxidoreductase (luciferase family)